MIKHQLLVFRFYLVLDLLQFFAVLLLLLGLHPRLELAVPEFIVLHHVERSDLVDDGLAFIEHQL